MLERGWRFEDFSDKVGDVFTIAEDGVPAIALRLAEAALVRTPQPPPGGRPAFSLIFVDAEDRRLEQRIYRLEHHALGLVALFLVPIGKDARGVNYQALFN